MRETDSKTMLSALPSLPSTPPQTIDRSNTLPPNRRLWSSPAISDYFSGDDGSTYAYSPESSLLRSSSTWDAGHADRKLQSSDLTDPYLSKSLSGMVLELHQSRSSQMQRLLLARLNAVGRAILAADLTEHHCENLSLDIDRLESTLAAPDSQTREPAEIAEVGLFVDDDAEETDVESTIISDKAISNSTEATELVTSVVRAATNLREQFNQLKHVNDIATEKLEAAAQEISRLRDVNQSLKEDDPESELLYLKLRLNQLEQRAKEHLDRKGQEDLLDDIVELNIATSPSKPTHGPTVRQNNRTISQRSAHETDVRDMNGNDDKPVTHVNGNFHAHPFSPEVEDLVDEDPDMPKDDVGIEDDQFAKIEQDHPEPQKRRTPWQLLWDELADFAGIHEGYKNNEEIEIDEEEEDQ